MLPPISEGTVVPLEGPGETGQDGGIEGNDKTGKNGDAVGADDARVPSCEAVEDGVGGTADTLGIESCE
jgi:hypothetical protein